MSTLPFVPPGCDQPATTRIEVYSPADGGAHGSLDASVYACDQHDADAVAAISAASLTAYQVYMAPGVERPCGSAYVYPTGAIGGSAR